MTDRCPTCGSTERPVYRKGCGVRSDHWHTENVEGVSPEAEETGRGSVAPGAPSEPRQAPSTPSDAEVLYAILDKRLYTQRTEGRAALDRILAENERLKQERDEAVHERQDLQGERNWQELAIGDYVARITELEGALREVVDQHEWYSAPIARAALAETEEGS